MQNYESGSSCKLLIDSSVNVEIWAFTLRWFTQHPCLIVHSSSYVCQAGRYGDQMVPPRLQASSDDSVAAFYGKLFSSGQILDARAARALLRAQQEAQHSGIRDPSPGQSAVSVPSGGAAGEGLAVELGIEGVDYDGAPPDEEPGPLAAEPGGTERRPGQHAGSSAGMSQDTSPAVTGSSGEADNGSGASSSFAAARGRGSGPVADQPAGGQVPLVTPEVVPPTLGRAAQHHAHPASGSDSGGSLGRSADTAGSSCREHPGSGSGDDQRGPRLRQKPHDGGHSAAGLPGATQGHNGSRGRNSDRPRGVPTLSRGESYILCPPPAPPPPPPAPPPSATILLSPHFIEMLQRLCIDSAHFFPDVNSILRILTWHARGPCHPTCSVAQKDCPVAQTHQYIRTPHFQGGLRQFGRAVARHVRVSWRQH